MAVIVNAVILKNNKILTVKRGKEPFKGMYGFPGGHVELNETKEDALRREVLEEINSEVKVGEYIAMIPDSNNDVYLYLVEVVNWGEFFPSSEIVEIKWLGLEEFVLNLKEYDVKNWRIVKDVLMKYF